MTDEQKRELEKQANLYSYSFYKDKKNGEYLSTEAIKFGVLQQAVNTLGHEFVYDGNSEMLGTTYTKYKLVEIKK